MKPSIFEYNTYLNLKGGPSKTAIVLSSLPVISLNGLAGLKSHELIGLLWPEISPTDVPVSAINTWPNLKPYMKNRGMKNTNAEIRLKIHYVTHLSLPSPTTTMRWLSGDHAMSLMGPPIGWNSFFKICSLLTVSQIRTLPDWSVTKNGIYFQCTIM